MNNLWGLALSVFSLMIPSHYQSWVKPFRFAKSNVQIPFHPSWEVDKAIEVNSILSQPFTYLGQGVQSYAFLSADGKYVLKLFRFDSCKMKQGQRMLSFLKKRKTKKARLSAEKVLEACKIAFDQLQEETALVFIHLNPGGSLPPIKLKDYLGFTHFVDPSKTRFVLQKKADKIFPALRRAFREDKASFYQMIRSFYSLLSSFEKKGITTRDSKLPSNFGFFEGKAIQIDFADNSYDQGDAILQMEKFRSILRCWLQKNAPNALYYLDEVLSSS